MLIALLVFAVAAGLVVAIEQTLRPHLANDPVNAWLCAHVYLPGLRMLAVLLFVLAAYPDLFGTTPLPTLGEVLGPQDDWFGESLNLLFVVALLAPLLPVVGGIPGVALPLQAVALTALLFSWTTNLLGAPFTPWPGAGAAATMLLLAAAAPVAGGFLVRHTTPERRILAELLVLGAQLPIVVIYARALGATLPGT